MRKPNVLTSLTFAAAIAVLAGPIAALHGQDAQKLTPTIKLDDTPLERNPGNSFSHIVEKVAPSVVTVSTTRSMASMREEMQRNPFFNDPFWRRFFGMPEDEEPNDQTRPQQRPRRQQQAPNQRGNRQMPAGLGSGVIVSSEGHILTNNHVIDGADEILVTLATSNREVKAKLIGADPEADLAVLKIEGSNHPAITFGDSEKVKVGDFVLAIGNPFALKQTVTSGIVSAVGRGGTGIVQLENFIQTDASINPGNSGGALVDTQGRLIGLNTAIFSRTGGNQGIGFAVPANLARLTLESIIKTGKVSRGFLGVMLQPLNEELANAFKIDVSSGALVAEVTPNSPAAKAGLENGDVIVELNGKKVEGSRELMLLVASQAPGSKVSLKVIRNGKEQTLEAQLGERPVKNLVAKAEPQSTDPDVLDGVTVADIDDQMRNEFDIPANAKGVVITDIDPDSDAFAAGLRKGDVIHEIEKQAITNSKQAVEISEQVKKEKKVLLRVSSRGASRFVVVTSRQE